MNSPLDGKGKVNVSLSLFSKFHPLPPSFFHRMECDSKRVKDPFPNNNNRVRCQN